MKKNRQYELTYIGADADTLFYCVDSRSIMPEKDKHWFENNVVRCSECGKKF